MRPKQQRQRDELKGNQQYSALVQLPMLQQQPLHQEQVLELLELQQDPRKDQVDVGVRVGDVSGIIGERRGELFDSLNLPLLEITAWISKRNKSEIDMN